MRKHSTFTCELLNLCTNVKVALINQVINLPEYCIPYIIFNDRTVSSSSITRSDGVTLGCFKLEKDCLYKISRTGETVAVVGLSNMLYSGTGAMNIPVLQSETSEITISGSHYEYLYTALDDINVGYKAYVYRIEKSDYFDSIKSAMQLKFSHGAVSTIYDTIVEYITNRVTSDFISIFEQDMEAVCDQSVEIRIAKYDANFIFVGMDDDGYSSGKRSLPYGYNIRITARNAYDTTSEITNISDYPSLMTIVGKTYTDVIKSQNLFDVNKAILGKCISSSGAETSISSNYAISEFIEISPSAVYVIATNQIVPAIEVAWYQSYKTFISRTIDSSAGVVIGKEIIEESPANAKYARVGYSAKTTSTPASIETLTEVGCVFMLYSEYIYNLYFENSFDYSPQNIFNYSNKNYYDSTSAGYEGKRISIMGDSITTFAGYNASMASDGHLISDGVYTYPGKIIVDIRNLIYYKVFIKPTG